MTFSSRRSKDEIRMAPSQIAGAIQYISLYLSMKRPSWNGMRVVNASSFLSVVNQKEMDSSAFEIFIFSLLRMLKQPFSSTRNRPSQLRNVPLDDVALDSLSFILESLFLHTGATHHPLWSPRRDHAFQRVAYSSPAATDLNLPEELDPFRSGSFLRDVCSSVLRVSDRGDVVPP